ncbi:MAG: hypothetical protein HYX39_03365 [Bacteroidetes bacterium]|nr:hypothetical protein [Bacteroidota bacterium]
MKKILIVLTLFLSLKNKAQFFRGVGVFGAVTESTNFYKNTQQDQRDWNRDSLTGYNRTYYYPQNTISREYFSWGAGIFAEFGGNYGRWQTELEYVNKGGKIRELTEPFNGIRNADYSTNKYTYIQWNNYLKYFGPFGLHPNLYLMPGVRLEYQFSSSTSVYAPYSTFPKFWFSGNLGLGYEFPILKKINAFVEYHWNPDIIYHKKDQVKARNRTFELRFGLVYRPKKRSIDDCNAPRYKGPAY